ncbi:hypothetical protein JQ506_13010 [Shinella sp. PSBB067]|uniref:helix-turn-helix transcriptional regulator n=1 Tax=Shinella sp. PSBB067 TaxID=2715959 RepID=UPI00193BD54E|nr:hypothetical protein [Shinella sp. PSBB067]QRI61828.1 hypothetical protein JQ506_13010 [Shinella sp. PSBB067]
MNKAERTEHRWSLAEQRATELEEFVRHKFGGVVDTDDAEFLVDPMAATIAWKIVADYARRDMKIGVPELARLTAEYLRRWFPHLPVETVGAAARQAAEDRPNLKADEIAAALGVTFKERQALGLKTIGACDVPSRERKKRVRELKNDQRRRELERERRANGVKTRTEYIRQSKAELARLLGVSRKTIYAWEKDGTLPDRAAQAQGNRLFSTRGIIYSTGEQPVTFGEKSMTRGDVAGPIRPESDVTQAHTYSVDIACDVRSAPEGPAPSHATAMGHPND